MELNGKVSIVTGALVDKQIDEQAKIRVDKFYAKHNDGHIGPREFMYLNHELNHSNQHIYRLKHNDWTHW